MKWCTYSTIWLFVAGAIKTAVIMVHILCTPHNHPPVYSVIQSHIHSSGLLNACWIISIMHQTLTWTTASLTCVYLCMVYLSTVSLTCVYLCMVYIYIYSIFNLCISLHGISTVSLTCVYLCMVYLPTVSLTCVYLHRGPRFIVSTKGLVADISRKVKHPIRT